MRRRCRCCRCRHRAERAARQRGSRLAAPRAASCASSNRVGAMFALKAIWLEGDDQEEAMALGKRAGMKSLTGTVEKLLAK